MNEPIEHPPGYTSGPTIGELAYNAYCDARGWKSFDGHPLPSFKEQAPGIQQAWEKAATVVAIYVRGEPGERG